MSAGPGRNDPCSCGSGRKFKQCCGRAGPPGPAATELRRPHGPRSAGLTQAGRILEFASPVATAIRAGLADQSRRQTALPKPATAEGYYRLAISLEESGQPSAAIDAYRRAVELAPRLAEAHARLSTLLNVAGEREQAVQHLRRAAEAAPATTLGRLSRAKALLLNEEYEEAGVWLRRTLALDPHDAEANRLLGSLRILQGSFDEAAQSFVRAIEADPRDASAYLGLTRSRKMTDAERPMLARMEACLGAPSLPEPQRMVLHFALGKSLDDLGDHAAAWRHFEAANRLRARAGRLDRAACEARADRIIAAFTPEALRAGAAADHADETPIFILGMPRSGTTLVEQIVSSHPEIAGAGELRFWTSAGARWEREGGRMPPQADMPDLAREFHALLRGIAPEALRVTDKQPFNFLWIGLIRLAFPRAFIVHCQRDPVDTCLSIHTTQFAAPLDFAADQEDLAFFYRQYARLMEHWRAVLQHDRFLEL